MATVYHPFSPEEAMFLATAFPQYKKINGTAFPVSGLYYDAATDEASFFKFRAIEYPGSGNLTLNIDWYADTATASAAVVWETQIGVLAQNSDDQDIETLALGTLNFVSDSQIAGVDQRLMTAAVSITNLESLTQDDWVILRVARDANGTSATDDLAGDAVLTLAVLTYSDT